MRGLFSDIVPNSSLVGVRERLLIEPTHMEDKSNNASMKKKMRERRWKAQNRVSKSTKTTTCR